MQNLESFSLAGKTAVVAGASRGIGLAIAKAMAAAGARTVMAARSVEALEREAKALREAGYQAEMRKLDFTSNESIDAVVKEFAGVADILVNVSGTNVRKRFGDYNEEEYDFLMQTNLHGIVRLTQKIGTGMVERGKGGKIVNIGSLTSLLGLPYVGVYSVTKSALAGLTRALAAEWGPHNIQVNCIAPGFILTDLNRKMWQREEMLDWLKGAQSNPRLGAPEDIAPVAVFLASRASDYVTGQVIPVDGGYTTTARWPHEP